MPTSHVCPHHICEKYRGSNDEKKQAMREALQWLSQQDVHQGDKVFLPNPETGELEDYTATRDLAKLIIN